MKHKEIRGENRPPPTSPIRASQIATIELTPPPTDSAEVHENVTRENIVDIQRYLRWADKVLKPNRMGDEHGTDAAHPKAS
jgi:hypothetical protein